MSRCPTAVLVAAIAALCPGIALAIDLEAADACIVEGGGATCIQAELEECLSIVPEQPAVATVCFREAHESWGEAVAQLMTEQLSAEGQPERTAMAYDIIRAEGQFDLNSGLLRCERDEAISLITGEMTGPALARQVAHCRTMVVGMTYARALVRLQAFEAASPEE